MLLVVACALIDADGRILMSRRPDHKPLGGLWEFPGGKVDEGERAEQAIVRELREELGIEPCERCLQPFSFVSYHDEHSDLLMPLFLCRQWDGIARPMEEQLIRWVFPDQLLELELAPADIPLAQELRDRLPKGRRYVS